MQKVPTMLFDDETVLILGNEKVNPATWDGTSKPFLHLVSVSLSTNNQDFHQLKKKKKELDPFF